ncbi:MAG TPA: Gfo/Idh/MocA family oxidoreductase [Dongiaceae bacterium]|nr:Gfo/Idh/MocA family oxidoreductase [Dongiaceae bacterium]
MEPVRWGVISTAKIGVKKVLPGMSKSRQIRILAIASRDEKRARRWARKLGIPRAYGSYEALLEDPEIEAVYNPLPNHLHVPLTIAAAKAGKHVLCEKPIAITAAEAEKLRALPRDRLVAEAFMVRHHPQWQEVRKRAAAGAIGEVQAIQVFFSYFNVDPENVRNQADIGGGALLDIGCYPVVVARYIFGAEPRRAVALIERDPRFGTDRLTSGIVDFGSGRRLDFTVSTQSVPHQRVDVIGTRGRIEVPIPFNAPQGRSLRIYIDRGLKLGGAAAKPVVLPAADQYRLQAEAFGRALRGLEPLAYGVEDAIRQMRVIDALFRSAESGRWEAV